MQIDWFTFIAQIVNFLILIVLLQRFLYKPVIQTMDEREKKISSELEEARRKKVEAERKERDLEQSINELEQQKDQILDDTRGEVNEQRKEWMAELRNEISEIRRRWLDEVQNEKSAFLTALKEEAGDRIIQLIQNALHDLSELNLQQQTADFMLEKIRGIEQGEIEKIRRTIKQLQSEEAIVTSTFDVSDQQMRALKHQLDEIAGKELSYEFKKRQALGFGMEVRIGGWRFGWNLKSYLEQLGRQMEKYLKEQAPHRIHAE